MKIKTLIVALVAIILAGFCAISCKKAANKITTLLLEDTMWVYTNEAPDVFTISFTSSKDCTLSLNFAAEEAPTVYYNGKYTVNGLKVHIDWTYTEEEGDPGFADGELVINDLIFKEGESVFKFIKK